jgi:biopolymer transport protein ExbD
VTRVLLSRSRSSRGTKLVLPLTSLLDMFTIILVFLMVSFQAEDKDFVLHSGVKLPASNAKSPFKTGVNIAVTKDAVLVEGETVYKLERGGGVREADFEKGQVASITAAIDKAWSLHKREAGAEDIVVIQADRKLPYKTLHLIMRSAAFAGVFRFRLVVEKE